MAEQLVFDLPVETAFGRDDFFTSPANSEAVSAIESWRDWPLGKLVLAGPAGAGKSHLVQIWAEMSGGCVMGAGANWNVAAVSGPVCVENLHVIVGNRSAEEKLFHLHNVQAETGQALLMTGQGAPSSWAFSLPDLASRVQGSHLVQLGAPDDTLLAAVLLKQCVDRQLQVEPGVVEFILRRVERSFVGMRDLVVVLDRVSLQRKKPIGQGIVRETLAQMEELE
ncbi:MAG: DnaA/Hda family protein [Amylibacter sp.]